MLDHAPLLLLLKRYFRKSYRPGQPNWENTMWKFQDFFTTQILREINFGDFEAPKTVILTIRAGLNFEFLQIFDISKSEIFLKIKIQSLQNFKNGRPSVISHD